MTPEEQAKKIEEIYNEAINRLELLAQERKKLVKERDSIVQGYIKGLDDEKIATIRKSLGL